MQALLYQETDTLLFALVTLHVEAECMQIRWGSLEKRTWWEIAQKDGEKNGSEDGEGTKHTEM